jgi:hypothetical protein
MRQSSNEKTPAGNVMRRGWLLSMPVETRAHSSGATLVVAFLAALIAVSVLLTVFARLLLDHYESQVQAAPPPRIAALNQEAELLQKKVVGLVSESIEAKLQAIESSIQHGRVTAADLRLLDELRQELRILAGYTANAQAVASDPMLVRGGIPRPAESAEAGWSELSFVKGLLYFSIVSVGVAGLVAGGYWLHARRQRRLPPGTLTARPMLGRRPPPFSGRE